MVIARYFPSHWAKPRPGIRRQWKRVLRLPPEKQERQESIGRSLLWSTLPAMLVGEELPKDRAKIPTSEPCSPQHESAAFKVPITALLIKSWPPPSTGSPMVQQKRDAITTPPICPNGRFAKSISLLSRPL